MTRIISILLILGAVLASTSRVSLAQESKTTELVSTLLDKGGSVEASAAFMKLTDILHNGSPSEIKALQQHLCRRLSIATDAMTMRRISLVLASAPCDEAVMLVLDRLQAGPSQADPLPDTRAAACQSLGRLVSRRLPADPKIAELALSRIEAITRDHTASLTLLDEAVMTISFFGPNGFDALMRLRNDPKAPKDTGNIFYTALSDTGDVRALPVLREALADDRVQGGLRKQAVNAVGRLFHILNRRDPAAAPTERTLCSTALYQYLTDDTPDQLFGVALKSLAEITPIQRDTGALRVLHDALYSVSSVRQEAALDVVLQTGVSLDRVSSDFVRSIAEAHPDDSVRNTAAAVVGQIESNVDEESATGPLSR